MLRPIRSIVMRSSARCCVCAHASAIGGAARGQQSWTSGFRRIVAVSNDRLERCAQYGNSPPVPAAVELGAWDGTVPLVAADARGRLVRRLSSGSPPRPIARRTSTPTSTATRRGTGGAFMSARLVR